MAGAINSLVEGAFAFLIVATFLIFIYSRWKKQSFGGTLSEVIQFFNGETKMKRIPEVKQQIWQQQTTRM